MIQLHLWVLRVGSLWTRSENFGVSYCCCFPLYITVLSRVIVIHKGIRCFTRRAPRCLWGRPASYLYSYIYIEYIHRQLFGAQSNYRFARNRWCTLHVDEGAWLRCCTLTSIVTQRSKHIWFVWVGIVISFRFREVYPIRPVYAITFNFNLYDLIPLARL